MGDLSKQIEVDARGEILDLKNTVNGMVVRCVNRFPRLVLFRSSSAFPSASTSSVVSGGFTRFFNFGTPRAYVFFFT